jgi:hypothetical protein
MPDNLHGVIVPDGDESRKRFANDMISVRTLGIASPPPQRRGSSAAITLFLMTAFCC